ncbi:hypothetical protein Tco_1361023 [Tanacetum coccineum]
MARLCDLRTLRRAVLSSSFKSLAIIRGKLSCDPRKKVILKMLRVEGGRELKQSVQGEKVPHCDRSRKSSILVEMMSRIEDAHFHYKDISGSNPVSGGVASTVMVPLRGQFQVEHSVVLVQNQEILGLPILAASAGADCVGLMLAPRSAKAKHSSISGKSHEPIENQAPLIVTMADQRTMAQLVQAPTEGYEDAIVVLAITADNFELKHGLLTLVRSS